MSKKPLKSKLIFILPLILFIGVIVILFSRLNKTNNQAEQSQISGISNNSVTNISVNTAINKLVPKFQLPDLTDATKIRSNTHLPQEAFMLNVWGSWCIACSREHPLLMTLHEQGHKIVGVSYKDEREYANKILNESGNPFLFNIYDEEGDLGIDLGLTGAPETFVVDEQGIIRQHIVGEITKAMWLQRIEPCFSAVKDGQQTQEALASVCQ